MSDTLTKSVERGTYQGLVDAVLGQVYAALTNDAYDDEDSEPAAKRLRILREEGFTPGQRAMEARFVLGADDALYLQSAVSVLSAGHEDKGEIAIPEGQFLGPNVVNSVRRAIEADQVRRANERHNEARPRLKDAMVVVAWLLRIPEVRIAVHTILETDAAAGLRLILDDSSIPYEPVAFLAATTPLVNRGGEGLEAVCRVLQIVYSFLDEAFSPAALAKKILDEIEQGVDDFETDSTLTRDIGIQLLNYQLSQLIAQLDEANADRAALKESEAQHRADIDNAIADLTNLSAEYAAAKEKQEKDMKAKDETIGTQEKEIKQQQKEITQHQKEITKQLPNSENILVRNLENVQGVEREFIIISVGYGYDPENNFRMNFINTQKGENHTIEHKFYPSHQ